MEFAYDRQKLYDQVWDRPAMYVAREYGVSPNALAKACRKLRVPTPPRGYWTKMLHHRQLPPRPPLPPLDENVVAKRKPEIVLAVDYHVVDVPVPGFTVLRRNY